MTLHHDRFSLTGAGCFGRPTKMCRKLTSIFNRLRSTTKAANPSLQQSSTLNVITKSPCGLDIKCVCSDLSFGLVALQLKSPLTLDCSPADIEGTVCLDGASVESILNAAEGPVSLHVAGRRGCRRTDCVTDCWNNLQRPGKSYHRFVARRCLP